jgi:DNA mismatch repair protein MutL
MPNHIHLLDENTANRIAAGEVVERPASAVKELVENAIDAGATQILVMLEDGGKRRIEVADNGCGMGPEDAVLALQRHATSKIRSADDLFAVRTLGFRGEALPSIASVSHLTLTTKAPEEVVGVRIIADGGEIAGVEEMGAPDGTVVVVADLFYNTPARLKFLKSMTTEYARCMEVVGHLSIAHPSIRFRVRHGGQEVFSTSGSGDPLGALAAVWGRDIARHLIPIRHEEEELIVWGFIASPQISRPGRSHELFFVNRRPIRSRLLGHALEDAFRSFTPESRYPIAALFVDIAPEKVDVNVHPTKTEVKFLRDGEVHHAVSQAVQQALRTHGILPTLKTERQEARREETSGQGAFGGRDFEALARAAVDAFRPPKLGAQAALSNKTDPQEKEPVFLPEGTTVPTKPFAEQLRGFRVLGQARNTYIIAITDGGVAFIDQHVAHERVLYERLTVKRQEFGTPAQQLAIPFTLSLGPAEAALLKQRLGDFVAVGWEIEPFGRDSFLVRSVPSLIAKGAYEALLRDMIDELAHQSVSRRLIVLRDHVTITHACKMAVKAGDPLTMEEMTGLLHQLADTENPYLCPHGRPIVVMVPFEEIDRRFKRG